MWGFDEAFGQGALSMGARRAAQPVGCYIQVHLCPPSLGSGRDQTSSRWAGTLCIPTGSASGYLNMSKTCMTPSPPPLEDGPSIAGGKGKETQEEIQIPVTREQDHLVGHS